MKEKILTERQIRIRSVFSFLFFIAAFATGIFLWKRLLAEPPASLAASVTTGNGEAGTDKKGSPSTDRVSSTLRASLNFSDKIFASLFSKSRLAKTYPKSEAVAKVRVNGKDGLSNPADADTSVWRLNLLKSNGDSLKLTLLDLQKLPKTEVVFDFKCIEGWSQKTWWGGVRFSDFVKYYHLENETGLGYAGLSTPDKKYYVGIDMPSMLQPQTLLCYEMNGQPLPLSQGFPLRLIIPVKYGIKHLKRIGTIYFSNAHPPDFWAERGYDYYSGH